MLVCLGASERDFLDLTNLIESDDSSSADVSNCKNMSNKGSARFLEAACGIRKGLSAIDVKASRDLGFILARTLRVAKDFLEIGRHGKFANGKNSARTPILSFGFKFLGSPQFHKTIDAGLHMVEQEIDTVRTLKVNQFIVVGGGIGRRNPHFGIFDTPEEHPE
jgi:hypothetical protein